VHHSLGVGVDVREEPPPYDVDVAVAVAADDPNTDADFELVLSDVVDVVHGIDAGVDVVDFVHDADAGDVAGETADPPLSSRVSKQDYWVRTDQSPCFITYEMTCFPSLLLPPFVEEEEVTFVPCLLVPLPCQNDLFPKNCVKWPFSLANENSLNLIIIYMCDI